MSYTLARSVLLGIAGFALLIVLAWLLVSLDDVSRDLRPYPLDSEGNAKIAEVRI
ncbi:MAG: hypothetical protein Q8P39_03815 [Candidatus Yanofskybacteria bacterium]|nr:hypothetical protein [Candidatus Yanofskybacteria bacterium]